MNDQELVQAMQAFIEEHQPPAAEAELVSQELIRRDTWRLRILASLSILFGLAGIVGIFIVFFSLRNYLIMSSSELEQLVANAGQRSSIFRWERAVNHSLEIAMACLAASMIGSFCLVWLISSSRRATLNQINISLMRLSEQIKKE